MSRCLVRIPPCWPMIHLCKALCVLPGRPVSSSCPVQISPPTVVVRFGDPLRIICSSTSDQIESIGLESMYGGEKTAGVSSVVLNITSVEHWEVLVICFLNRVKVGQCSENFPVTVYSKYIQGRVDFDPSIPPMLNIFFSLCAEAPDRVSISQPGVHLSAESNSPPGGGGNVQPEVWRGERRPGTKPLCALVQRREDPPHGEVPRVQ